jgi:hypothetical protein
MMARDIPDYRTSPIMTDPNGLIPAQGIEQVEHIPHYMFLRVFAFLIVNS